MKPPSALSYSSISTWEQCPYKYMRLYDGGDQKRLPRAHAAAAQEGSLVHDVLEVWHKDRSQDWRQILKDVAKNNKDFDGKPAYIASTSEQYISASELLEEYMKREDIYPDIVDTEIPFEFVLPNGVPVRGRIDRVDKINKNHYSLVDYKTTRTFIWKSEVEKSLQGMMYVLVAENFLYPDINKFSFTIDALRFKPITVEFDRRQLVAAMDYMEVVYDRISETEWKDCEPRLNKFCGYCQLQDECPAIKDLKENKKGMPRDFEGNNMDREPENFAEDYLLYSELESCGKKAKTQAQNMLDGIMVNLGSNSETFGDYDVFYRKTYAGNPKLVVEKK